MFWHTPGPGVDVATYEASLVAFHTSLDPATIEGFEGCRTYRVEGAEWMDAQLLYEDWYYLTGFAALGTLNAAAVDEAHHTRHEAIAHLAGAGAGGVYAILRGGPPPSDDGLAVWFAKPVGMSYDALLQAVDVRGTLWRRQMVLGPAPEFCLVDGDPPPGAATIVTRRRVIGETAS